MNSITRSDHPCHKSDKSCPTIIKCGCSNSTVIPAAAGATTVRNFTVSSLTLNTSHLENACIKLEFASNIVAATALIAADVLTFQVFKSCPNQITPTPIGPSWTFSEVGVLSSTFSFFVCDCDSCFNDCCTYTVVASAVVTLVPISINNASLGAIATCGTNHCC